MNVLMYIFERWSDILVVLVLMVALFVVVRAWIRSTTAMLENASVQDKLSWLGHILGNLVPITLALVTEAEIDYGDGTGPIKRSSVIAQLYDYIPDEFKQFVTEAQLARIVEMVLADAKTLWGDKLYSDQLKEVRGLQ